MQLNISCLRDILLYCESSVPMTESLSFDGVRLNQLSAALTDYSKSDIAYSLIMLDEANLVDCYFVNADNGIVDALLYRLTYSGHQFLEEIKPEPVWNKVQKVSGSIGSKSLDVLSSIASSIISSLIQGNLS
ncbi:MAG: DUF2513 domain-containing protein [Hespellia sp.]|nr:DUF2513 domain-containing protein [Hespellia sp.]